MMDFEELTTNAVALVMSREADPGLKEYMEWMQKELLCRELELTRVAYFDSVAARELDGVFVLLVWTPSALDAFSNEENPYANNSTVCWLQENTLSNQVINLYTNNTVSTTLPNWASYFRKFYLPLHSSTTALGAYMKLEPNSKLNCQTRVDWELYEQDAKDVLRFGDQLELGSLHRLLPHANKKSGEGGRVSDDYKFKDYRTLIWYMLNIGYLKAESVLGDFSDAIKRYSTKSANGVARANDLGAEDESCLAKVYISEQPKSQGYRFRYECEGYTHGGIPGEYSERGRKTHPTLMFNGYEGRVVVVGFLLGDEGRYQHANSLVGRDVYHGIMVRYGVVSASSPKMELSNISIQHCKKKLIAQSAETQLEMRKLVEKMGVDALRTALSSGNMNGSGSESALEELMKKQLSEEDYKEIKLAQEKSSSGPQNLSAVKLSLIIYTHHRARDQFAEVSRLTTDTIYDSQSVHSSSPRICRMNANKGFPEGGKEILILCEKIQKADIQVIFSAERDSVDNETGWYRTLDVTSNDVHHQYAVTIKTPPYIDMNIKNTETVYIRLRRMSDSLYSNAVEFSYEPQLHAEDPEGILRKKMKEETLDHLIRI